MIDDFDRKNEDTLDNLKGIVNDISASHESLQVDVRTKLKEYRNEISRFKKEFNEKASKKEFAKTLEVMQENRGQFDI